MARTVIATIKLRPWRSRRRPNLAFLGEDVPTALDRDELRPLESADSAVNLRTVQLVHAIIPAKGRGDLREGCGAVL